MKILLISLLLICSDISYACKINRPIISLSGSVTLALSGLNLLSDPNLRGISVFHPNAGNPKLKRLPGGIFISSRTLSEFQNITFIYDESIELMKTLKKSQIQSESIVTRGLIPDDVVRLTLEKLKPFLSQCDENLKKYQDNIKFKILKIRQKLSKKMSAVFFVGEIRNEKYPDLIMTNDGFIKWLKMEKLIETYPSNLAYIQWSTKILSEVKIKYKIGIKDTGTDSIKKVNFISKNEFNLLFPGALIPGEGQLDAIIFLLDQLEAVE